MANAFQDQFLCQSEPLPQPLWELAREYSRRTEAFDRSVCTGPVTRDGVMPTGPRELAAVGRHAIAVMHDVQRSAAEQGFTREQLREAMRAYERSGQAAADMQADFPIPQAKRLD